MNSDDTAAIAQVHEHDVAEVRALLRQAIETAGERWLPMNAIADALARELVVLQGYAPQRLHAGIDDPPVTEWHAPPRRSIRYS
jgi:hypothetical protein